MWSSSEESPEDSPSPEADAASSAESSGSAPPLARRCLRFPAGQRRRVEQARVRGGVVGQQRGQRGRFSRPSCITPSCISLPSCTSCRRRRLGGKGQGRSIGRTHRQARLPQALFNPGQFKPRSRRWSAESSWWRPREKGSCISRSAVNARQGITGRLSHHIACGFRAQESWISRRQQGNA